MHVQRVAFLLGERERRERERGRGGERERERERRTDGAFAHATSFVIHPLRS